MEFEKFDIEGIILCKPKIFNDNRGFFTETYRKNILESFSTNKFEFCQTNISESKLGVLRGLHFQNYPKSQTKFVSVMRGEILDVTVDMRKDSKTFGKTFSVILNDVNNYQLLVPKGFAHGFISLSKKTKIKYDVDEYYSPKHDLGINAFDPKLNIDWILKKEKIIRNKKDIELPLLENIKYNL